MFIAFEKIGMSVLLSIHTFFFFSSTIWRKQKPGGCRFWWRGTQWSLPIQCWVLLCFCVAYKDNISTDQLSFKVDLHTKMTFQHCSFLFPPPQSKIWLFFGVGGLSINLSFPAQLTILPRQTWHIILPHVVLWDTYPRRHQLTDSTAEGRKDLTLHHQEASCKNLGAITSARSWGHGTWWAAVERQMTTECKKKKGRMGFKRFLGGGIGDKGESL